MKHLSLLILILLFYGCAGLPRDGWEGKGLNPAHIHYTFINIAKDQQSQIEKALHHWSRYIDIHFTFVPVESKKADWIFRTNTIDGPYNQHANTTFIFRHAFITFDADEPWEQYPKGAFYYLALHEIGHALGLDHSKSKTSIMYVNPYLDLHHPISEIPKEDIKNIQSIYKSRN